LAPGEVRWLAVPFLAPALVLLAAILLYPLIYSIVRSLFADGTPGGSGSFAGLRNYGSIFTDSSTLRAVENNLLWLVIVPTIVTILGLIFAVLTERIRWATAFKTVLFMPMAISALASGITFALIYADQPSRGLANAVTVGIHDTFGASSAPTWMICATSRLNPNPSRDRTVIDDNLASKLCDSVREAQFSTMFVVGTSSTFITRVFTGCLPGYSGVTQTPLWPAFTRSPCLNSNPLTSSCARPTNEMTTPT